MRCCEKKMVCFAKPICVCILYTPGKHSVPFFQATVASFKGKIDGN